MRSSVAARVAVDLRALVPKPTGIGVYTLSLLRELARRARPGGEAAGPAPPGWRYLGLAHKPPHHAAELAAAGVEVECQGAPLGVIWQQVVLPLRLRRGGVDLLWSPLGTLPLRCPVPAVATVHDLTAMLLPEAHRAKVRWSMLPFLRPSLEMARVLVTLSRATADDLAFYFPQCAAKVRVVYPGVDPEFQPGEQEEIAATRRELAAPDGYLLYAGTLEPRKNVAALLDAWEALRGGDPTVPPLILAGPYGWGSRRLARRIEALAGRGVTALGRVERPRLVRIVQAARLFVYPSLYEGFGLPPAEALACGVPAVVADSSSLPEVVGEAGVRVPPGDSAALAAALRALLHDPGRERDLRARAAGQAGRFRWPRAAAEMEEVFAEALA
ncbi:MAG TPA: glycosyltransferase family 1 protein [Thermoanaerobaculia bacterium]|nr:glycosyltransferase family 1 protein [Thermoanaerobaculia bacterium]